jgi:alkylation response protein AidB-like acyl-CoA dehydrogenase/predicted heme/steroid binding protein
LHATISLTFFFLHSFQTLQEYTLDQVKTHNKKGDAWLVIDSIVYDVSRFAAMHPGGESIVLMYAGKDCTKEFDQFHRQEVLVKYTPSLAIGRVAGQTRKVKLPEPGDSSLVPYAESSFFMKFKSPYFDESHVAFRDAVRKFVDSELIPHAAACENSGKEPSHELWKKMGQFGLLASRIGPGPHLKWIGRPLPSGIAPEKFTYFHEMIAHEEMSRMGYPGFSDGLGAGYVIGLPALLNFGTKELKEKYAPPCLLGEKRICLAITEAVAGSDVANIQTTAKKSECGKFYIVNGSKKWITNGTFCDYFVTAVRTGGPGIMGISMLMIERSPGLETKGISTSYSPCAGTSFITYDNVKVPVENLLGKENMGFQVIMYNFNHERWAIIAAVQRYSRLVIEECVKWAHQRLVFGKRLIDQPVIRHRLAHMISEVEGAQNWLENITYQMQNMSYKEQSVRLAGPIALCKMLSTRAAQTVSDEACSIFGGRAITKTGMGRIVESFQVCVCA